MESSIFLVGVSLLLFFSCQPKKATQSLEWEISFDSLYTRIVYGTPTEEKLQKVQEILEGDNLSDSAASHTFHLLGLIHLSASNLNEAEKNLRKSLTFLPENEPSEQKVRNLHALGLVALKRNKLFLANYYISQASELIIQNRYRIKYPKTSSTIIGIATNLNRYNKSFASALRYAKAYPDFYEEGISFKENMVNTTLIVAGVYSNPSINDLDSVEFYLNRAIQLKDSLEINSEKLDKNIIYAKAEIFFNQAQYDSCLYYQHLIMAKSKSEKFSKSSNLIALYAELGKMDSAALHLETADNNYAPEEETDVLNYLENKTHFFIAIGESDSALSTFKKLQSKIIEKQIDENVRAINELSTLYSLQSKESKIKKLTQEVGAIQFTLERRNLYLIGLGILLLFSVIAIAFGVSNNKRRKLKAENERISALNNKVDLEQRLLRSQMDPHFIFNSLGAIQSFIRQEKKAESLSYLNIFSKLLRGNLESSRAKAITLEGEVGLLEKYLQLQQIRNPNSFSYEVILSESAEEEKEELEIPPMLIQPFVENAIIHGIRGIDSGGEISIQIDFSEDLLLVKVLDNGKGLSNETDSNHKSHATNIVRERLKILEQLTQKPARLSIKNREIEQGVLVELQVPLFG